MRQANLAASGYGLAVHRSRLGISDTVKSEAAKARAAFDMFNLIGPRTDAVIVRIRYAVTVAVGDEPDVSTDPPLKDTTLRVRELYDKGITKPATSWNKCLKWRATRKRNSETTSVPSSRGIVRSRKKRDKGRVMFCAVKNKPCRQPLANTITFAR